jgi:hypothetical protein
MQSPFQLLLDLFDEPKPSAPPPAPLPAHVPDFSAAPAESLDQVLSPHAFRHPDANREALLDGVLVAYEFRRGKRKNIGFAVGPEGLVVSAPRWVPLAEVDQAVRNKARWIVAKLEEARERKDRLAAAKIEWKDGATLPSWGEPEIVVLDPRHNLPRRPAAC